MKQPHTEQTVEHTETQQNTGNHKKPDAPDKARRRPLRRHPNRRRKHRKDLR